MSDQSQQQISDADFESIGFTPVHEKGDDGTETLATASVSKIGGTVSVYAKADDTTKLYVGLEDEPAWLWLPIDPSVDELKKLYEVYVAPTIAAADSDFPAGAEAIAQTVVLREAEGRVGLAAENAKTVKWFIGHADYDDYMVGIENSLVFNNWLNQNMIRMATANGGHWSQWNSLYSRSLITIMRWDPAPGNEVSSFTVEVQYKPVDHSGFVQSALEENSNDQRSGLFGKIPKDLPLDVIGFLFDAKFEIFWDKDSLIKWAKDGEDAYVQHLPVVVSDDDYEDAFLQLADHPSQQLRDFIAREVIWRENKKAYEAIKANGVSEDVIELAKEHNLES